MHQVNSHGYNLLTWRVNLATMGEKEMLDMDVICEPGVSDVARTVIRATMGYWGILETRAALEQRDAPVQRKRIEEDN